jgi:YVTN family beta-propeller protein
MSRRHILWCMPRILSICLAGRAAPAQSDGVRFRAVDRGISVELSMAALSGSANQPLREGADVSFRLKVSDVASGAPVRGAYPSAWMHFQSGGQPAACGAIIEGFVNAKVGSRADLNLNTYYVLALNDDATITVVDPLFGYGGTKLLSLIQLPGRGEDWALLPARERLFVSIPDANEAMAIDTRTWKPAAHIPLGGRPHRMAMQPDGTNVWIANDSGAIAVSTASLQIAARIETGPGEHAVAFSADSRFVAVTNAEAGTVSLLDAQTLAKIRDVRVGGGPASVAFSELSQMFYVAGRQSGAITAIDPRGERETARIAAGAGLEQIRFAPGGKLGFVVNPEKNEVYILDTASNQIFQTARVAAGPDQVVFSERLAYIRQRHSETVVMIPLDISGKKGAEVAAADFPGGQHPLGEIAQPSLADSFAQAPGENAMLVANAADKAIYYYSEGMAAPMGSFTNYSRQPRAILVVNRTLRELAPGEYQTSARLGPAGEYTVAMHIDSPAVTQCFPVTVLPDPERTSAQGKVKVDLPPASAKIAVGGTIRLRFRLSDSLSGAEIAGLRDVRIVVMFLGGAWEFRDWAQSEGGGVYGIDFVPPSPGSYRAMVQCQSRDLSFNQSPQLVFEAVANGK